MPGAPTRSSSSTASSSRPKDAGGRAFASSSPRTPAPRAKPVERHPRTGPGEDRINSQPRGQPGRDQEPEDPIGADPFPGITPVVEHGDQVRQSHQEADGELNRGVARRDRTPTFSATPAQ